MSFLDPLIPLMGYVAAFCTTAAFIPQVILIWRKRSAAGISYGMYIAFCFGVFLWLCYGVLIHAWPLAINNGVTLVLASSVLAMKWHFERPGTRAAGVPADLPAHGAASRS